jgi:hypothetical protein
LELQKICGHTNYGDSQRPFINESQAIIQ